MSRWNSFMVHAFAASAIAASPLIAQKKDKAAAGATANSCSISTDKPDEVKSAMNALTVAQIGGRPEDQQKRLKAAVTSLTGNPSKFKDNQAGHDYVLGAGARAVVAAVSRLDDGAQGNASATSTERIRRSICSPVRTRCSPRGEVESRLRRRRSRTTGSKAMRPIAIKASTLHQHRQRRAGRGGGESPQGDRFAVAAQPLLPGDGRAAQEGSGDGGRSVRAGRGGNARRMSDADSNLKAALELGAAQMTRLSAQSATGDQKKTGMLKAADLLSQVHRRLSEEPERAGCAAGARGVAERIGRHAERRQAVGRHARDAGQLYGGAALRRGHAGVHDEPVRAGREAHERGAAQEPMAASGLYNAANVYWKAGDFDRMLLTSKKLTQIDPNNPDEYQLLALAYQGKAKATKDPKIVQGLQRLAQRGLRREREGEDRR